MLSIRNSDEEEYVDSHTRQSGGYSDRDRDRERGSEVEVEREGGRDKL